MRTGNSRQAKRELNWANRELSGRMFERIAAEHQKRNRTRHISPPRRNEMKNKSNDGPILPRKFALYEADELRR
jgi:hypothetical protein